MKVLWLDQDPARAPLRQDFLPDQLEPLLKERAVNGTVVIQAV